jgi:hypothetical protein
LHLRILKLYLPIGVILLVLNFAAAETYFRPWHPPQQEAVNIRTPLAFSVGNGRVLYRMGRIFKPSWAQLGAVDGQQMSTTRFDQSIEIN